ncbi:IRK-interacting protein-like [Phalaenopsis equestris]|uniref:IRK-interacting protein-like n=1 Tax=Phalaenopsis equestris TaxID=78828 RepID=UPI0009E41AA9|nr:IRK-interacting protein-like [Phalaenopsis equestris]
MASSAANSQAGVAGTVEHRAINAALLRSSSKQAGASPSSSRFSNKFSATSKDYPVFNPTYEEEPLPRHPHIRFNGNLMKSWSRFTLIGNAKSSELEKSDTKSVNGLSSLNNDKYDFSTEHLSNKNLFLDHNHFMQTAPGADLFKSSSRNTTGDSETSTNSISCKHGLKKIKQAKSKSLGGPVTSLDKPTSLSCQLKSKGPTFSWLFRGSKMKSKHEVSPKTIESEDLSQLKKEWGVFSIDMLRDELQEAYEKRRFAMTEVAEMRSSLGELQRKFFSLESYCEELKMALKQEIQGKDSLVLNNSKRTKQKINSGRSTDESMPVSHEVVVEEFLHIVSEVRISTKLFCETLISQIDETDSSLMDKLSILLHQYPITPDNKNSEEVISLLEALINKYLYQDFENCIFQKNGSPKVLDPNQNRLENFSAFVLFRNMSWNDILRKGTNYYGKDFSQFCDKKMSCIVSILNWWRPWPEIVLQSFIVTAKCLWLLHLLAYSFNPPVMIFRVDENRRFDPMYMEDALPYKQQGAPAQVKKMVTPGFYVKDRVLRCRVMCTFEPL